MIKGLFECGSFSTGTAARFISDVISEYNAGTPLLKAAGIHLPKLELPRFEECFISLGPAKSAYPSQWRKRFEEHQKQDCYLNKRQPNALLLDPEQLRKTLERLRGADANPRLPEATLAAFDAYIEAEGTRGPATEHLLFDHDWSHVRNCFDRQKKTTSAAFAAKTRDALELAGISPSVEDEGVLVALESNPRKSGEAAQEFRDLFETYVKAISAFDLKLLLEWEDFVYGRRITCSDLFDGILECLQRTLRLREPGLDTWVVIEGANQNRPAHFISSDSRYQKVCEFFERHYGKLEQHTNKKIQFKRTLLPSIRPKSNRSSPKCRRKKIRAVLAARDLNFTLPSFRRLGAANNASQRYHSPGHFLKTQFSPWRVPTSDALVRYRSQSGKTALAEALGDYESVGRKGMPLSLSLHTVNGFAPSPGDSGRGSFIPRPIKDPLSDFGVRANINQATTGGWLARSTSRGVAGYFPLIQYVLRGSGGHLATDALDTWKVAQMVDAYRNLLVTLVRFRTRAHGERSSALSCVLAVQPSTSQATAQSLQSFARGILSGWKLLAARNRQLFESIASLLSKQLPVFSDGNAGALFFREMRELTATPLQPELTLCWDGMEPRPLIASQSLGAYTLHEPIDRGRQNRSFEDNAAESAKTIIAEVDEYLRLQPHERDNFSILLYNCDSPELPGKLCGMPQQAKQGRERWQRSPARCC